MANLKHRMQKVEEKTSATIWRLKCPECGEEWTILGDVPLDLMSAEWLLNTGADARHFDCDPELWRLAHHEHEPWAVIEERTNLPLGDPKCSGGKFGPVVEYTGENPHADLEGEQAHEDGH